MFARMAAAAAHIRGTKKGGPDIRTALIFKPVETT